MLKDFFILTHLQPVNYELPGTIIPKIQIYSLPQPLATNKAMFGVGFRGEEYLVAGVELDGAAGARGYGADAVGVDVGDGVRAEVLGVAQDSAPGAALLTQGDVLGADAVGVAVVLASDCPFEQVHFRRADKAGDEGCRWLVVELHGRADLLDAPGLEHDYLVGHGHGFDLIVGYVNHGGAELAVQFGELDAHLPAQCGVEVR